MRVPSHQRVVAPGLVFRAVDVAPLVVHRHVMKHPVGLGSLYGPRPRSGVRHWDQEGWNEVEPVVLTRDDRRDLVRRIREFDLDGLRCAAALLVLEQHARDQVEEALPCDACPARLAERCSEETTTLAERYVSHVQQALDALTRAAEVDRLELTRRVFGALVHRRPFPQAVLSVGLLPAGDAGIRINTADGVRIEFYFQAENPRWRTTYRNVPRGANDRVSFLLDLLPQAPSTALSAKTFVPRQWWKES